MAALNCLLWTLLLLISTGNLPECLPLILFIVMHRIQAKILRSFGISDHSLSLFSAILIAVANFCENNPVQILQCVFFAIIMVIYSIELRNNSKNRTFLLNFSWKCAVMLFFTFPLSHLLILLRIKVFCPGKPFP
jgi:hypothetical protein